MPERELERERDGDGVFHSPREVLKDVADRLDVPHDAYDARTRPCLCIDQKHSFDRETCGDTFHQQTSFHIYDSSNYSDG